MLSANEVRKIMLEVIYKRAQERYNEVVKYCENTIAQAIEEQALNGNHYVSVNCYGLNTQEIATYIKNKGYKVYIYNNIIKIKW